MQTGNQAFTRTLTWTVLASMTSALAIPVEASPQKRWVYSARFKVEVLVAHEDSTQFTLIPAEPGDNRPLSCDRFIVHARFQSPPSPNRYYFTQKRHNEAIRLLEAAVRNDYLIHFGSRGVGDSFEARSCEIDILGLNYTFETANDVFASFMIWPSWQ